MIAVAPAERRLIAAALAHLLRSWPDGAGSSMTRVAVANLLRTFADESKDGASREVPPSSPVMSTSEAATLLQITAQAVTARCRSGRLAAHRVGRAWVIDPSVLSGGRAS